MSSFLKIKNKSKCKCHLLIPTLLFEINLYIKASQLYDR